MLGLHSFATLQTLHITYVEFIASVAYIDCIFKNKDDIIPEIATLHALHILRRYAQIIWLNTATWSSHIRTLHAWHTPHGLHAALLVMMFFCSCGHPMPKTTLHVVLVGSPNLRRGPCLSWSPFWQPGGREERCRWNLPLLSLGGRQSHPRPCCSGCAVCDCCCFSSCPVGFFLTCLFANTGYGWLVGCWLINIYGIAYNHQPVVVDSYPRCYISDVSYAAM